MVLQYRKRKVSSRASVEKHLPDVKARSRSVSHQWRDYPGKKNVEGNPEDYEFRLLSHDRKKKIVESGSYGAVLRRMRQVEFWKRRRGQRRLRLGSFDFY